MTQLLTFLLLAIVLTMGPARAQPLHTLISFNTPVAPAVKAATGELPLSTDKKPVHVVFNARTGTVMMGEGISVRSAAVSHGYLNVTIREGEKSEPSGRLSGRKTAGMAGSEIRLYRGAGQVTTLSGGTRLRGIVDTLNSLGTSPDDTLGILQALKEAGALEAELVVM